MVPEFSVAAKECLSSQPAQSLPEFSTAAKWCLSFQRRQVSARIFCDDKVIPEFSTAAKFSILEILLSILDIYNYIKKI